MNKRSFVGLDVNRTCIQAMVRPTGEHWAANIDDRGINETAALLANMRPEIVVMEAQGGFELSIAGALASADLPLAFVSPRNVREFARSIGRIRGDQNHADLLAHFAELAQPEIQPMPMTLVDQLKSLKGRRQHILRMLELEREQETNCAAVQKDIRNHIYFLERSVAMLSEEISRTVRSSSNWR